MVEVVLAVLFAAGVVVWMVKTAFGKKNSSNSSGGTYGGGSVPEEPTGPINEQ